MPKQITPNATLTLLPIGGRRSTLTHDGAPVLEFILTVGATVAAPIGLNLVSNYPYDKLKKNGSANLNVSINRREVNFNSKGEITKIIEEEIKIEK